MSPFGEHLVRCHKCGKAFICGDCIEIECFDCKHNTNGIENDVFATVIQKKDAIITQLEGKLAASEQRCRELEENNRKLHLVIFDIDKNAEMKEAIKQTNRADKLQQRIATLEAALKEYADPEHWNGDVWWHEDGSDGPDIAKAALEGK